MAPLRAPPAAHLVVTRILYFVYRCGEICVYKLIASIYTDQIGAIQTLLITKLVTSPSKLSGHMSHPPPPPEVLDLKRESRILKQWSNPVSGSRKSKGSSPWAKQHPKLCKDWMEDLKDPLFLFLEGVKKDWHIHLWSG